jgi:predicted transglutaminase-like cysteine proteinase
MRLGAGVVLGACILATSAGRFPASPQSGDPVPLDAGYLEAAAFIDDSRQAVRQDAATQGRSASTAAIRPGNRTRCRRSCGEMASGRSRYRSRATSVGAPPRGRGCPAIARSLLNIVAEGAGHSGRARVGLINRAVDLAIAATSDQAQWGVADHWSPAFETLRTHRGDCEDYAIVKYVALLQAGLPLGDVKIVILQIPLRNEDHAAVAARVDGRWLILDNRRLALVRDTEMIGAIPRFVLDEDGTRRFVPSNRAGPGPSAGRSSPARFVRPA